MDDLTPEQMPEAPQQPHPPDGWELACLGIVRSDFGRRPSRALDKAIMQLSAEQAWQEAQREAGWWKRLQEAFTTRPGLRFAFGVALVFIVAGAGWYLFPTVKGQFQSAQSSASGCRIVDAANARWSGAAARLKPGDSLPAGQLRLESGVVELAFASGAKAAVEGPAELKLTGRNSVELHQGKITAEVPKPAIGFTVRTPNATVVDLGTRFGVNAKSKDSSEVDVFEGKVHVAEGRDGQAPENQWDLTRNMAMVLDARGGVTTAAEPETAFPQPGHAVLMRPANCGFDSPGFVKIGGFPMDLGFWSGPAFALTGATNGIRPVQGAGMLRFLAPPGPVASDSVVWQIVDLKPAKEFMATYGTTDLKAWVQFNRVAGGVHTASKFKLSIAAFRGQLSDAAALWAARNQTAVASAEKELTTDSDPKTWERVDVATTVSAEADFAVMEIRVIAPKDVVAGENPFPGDFADLIDAKVCLPLRPSNLVSAH